MPVSFVCQRLNFGSTIMNSTSFYSSLNALRSGTINWTIPFGFDGKKGQKLQKMYFLSRIFIFFVDKIIERTETRESHQMHLKPLLTKSSQEKMQL